MMSEQNSPVRQSPGRTRSNQEVQSPQQPSPVPSVRLSNHTTPIPARRTLLTSETGSFVLKSAIVFGAFGPITLPKGYMRHASDMIREGFLAAYEASCSHGSSFGSIGGSQLGSVRESTSPSHTTSQLIRNQEGLNKASYQWDETDVNFPPIQCDSEDLRSDDFVGKDLLANVGKQPEHLKNVHCQIIQPDVQAHVNVPADVHNPAANLGTAFAELAGQNGTTPEQTIKDKIQIFHIPDDEPSGTGQTEAPALNLEKKTVKKTYDAQKSSVTKMINKF
jgi:hypothetical protein